MEAQAPLSSLQAAAGGWDWLHHVRIGAYPLREEDAEATVKQAGDSGVFGIEVDNDITGRYESLLHPEEKLAALRAIFDTKVGILDQTWRGRRLGLTLCFQLAGALHVPDPPDCGDGC